MAEPLNKQEELIEMGGRSDRARARRQARPGSLTKEQPVALEVRPLPVRSQGRGIEIWGRELSPVAVAAAGGAAAGMAVVAVARRAARSPRRPPRRGLFRRREKVVSSRSFLVDVHVLGR